MAYTVGATVTLECTITDPDTGGPLDANDFVCEVKPPTGDNATPAVTKFAAGRYRASYPTQVAGEHWYRFESPTLGVAKEAAFTVDATHV